MWVEDRAWSLEETTGYPCSFPRCTGPAVAVLARSRLTTSRRTVRCHYCGNHLYGRRIANGRVEVRVHPDSPAARGYANETGRLR